MRRDIFQWAVTRGMSVDVAEQIASLASTTQECRIVLAQTRTDYCADCGEYHLMEPTLREIRDFGVSDPVFDRALWN